MTSQSLAQGALSWSRMYHFDLASVLTKTGAVTLPQAVLIGAILEIVSNYNRSTAEKITEWSMVGESFLKGSEEDSVQQSEGEQHAKL